MYNGAQVRVSLPGNPHQEKDPMKRTVRMLILMVGLLLACSAVVVPVAPALDGAPAPVCPPGSGGRC